MYDGVMLSRKRWCHAANNVNSIVLGHIQEGMGLRVKEKLTEDQLNNLESRHPLGFGDVNDVLNGIKFLTSPESKWITGSNIVIDGGYLA